jgi:heat shock protein HslJ
MKIRTYTWISILIISLTSCKKDVDLSIVSIEGSKWKLSHVIDGNGNQSNFPPSIDHFELFFEGNGKVDLFHLCNYSFGSYSITEQDSLHFSAIGAGTEMYCSPAAKMDWEVLFVNNMRLSKTFLISKEVLTIHCGEFSLVFD